MRFAGQRFRSQRQSMPKQRASSGYVGNFTARPTVQGLEPAMVSMPEVNAGSMAVTKWPDMGESPFSIGNFSEPEFRAPSRI